MSEPTTQPPEDPAAAPPQPTATGPAGRREWLSWLTGAGFVILATGLIWVWQHPTVPPASNGQTDALARQLAALEARVSRLEQRPQPQIPDLGPLSARVTALEHRPPPPTMVPASPDLAPLEARIAALDASGRATQAELSHRLEADESRIGASERAVRKIPLVQQAALALAAGQPLGDLPGAPPALARFAVTPPPTEAGLRLAFPRAAREALAAARPATEGRPLLTRLLAQAQDLITVRRGDRVVIGDPAAGVLEQARSALDAGDLAAAVKEVATLQGAAAQPLAAWLAQARSLLEARAALAAWAASG